MSAVPPPTQAPRPPAPPPGTPALAIAALVLSLFTMKAHIEDEAPVFDGIESVREEE